MPAKTEFTVRFGAFAPTIAEQFPMLPKNVADALQKDAVALMRVFFGGILIDTEYDRARERFVRKVETALAQQGQALLSKTSEGPVQIAG